MRLWEKDFEWERIHEDETRILRIARLWERICETLGEDS